MGGPDQPANDSQSLERGAIPGAPGISAFTLQQAQQSAIPIVIAVPHAGRAYPQGLVKRLRNPGCVVTRLEDRYADKLAERVCAATGAAMLVAQAPRAMIDLNRHTADIDWDMFADRPVESGLGSVLGMRARSGLGLIPRRLPGVGELWKGPHSQAELAERVALIHQPYHQCLEQTLADLRDRWGAALLLDLHSMPPLPRHGGQARIEFVVGDRFGAACHGALVASAFAHFSQAGSVAAHNRPYAGG
jgi:N-formylglutamate amidohydrolase